MYKLILVSLLMLSLDSATSASLRGYIDSQIYKTCKSGNKISLIEFRNILKDLSEDEANKCKLNFSEIINSSDQDDLILTDDYSGKVFFIRLTDENGNSVQTMIRDIPICINNISNNYVISYKFRNQYDLVNNIGRSNRKRYYHPFNTYSIYHIVNNRLTWAGLSSTIKRLGEVPHHTLFSCGLLKSAP